MKQRYLIWAFLIGGLMIPLQMAWAQDPVTGRVTDKASSEGLPGVTVLIKGTSRGTITDMSGLYTLNASAGDTLQFSFVGYLTQEVAVGNRTTVDVVLLEDVKMLDEVVAIGFGTTVRREVTGSIAKISGNDIENVSTPSFDAALQGRAAGVSVTQANGVPGGAVRVRVRGGSSITGGGDPLYVIDGVPITFDDFSANDSPVNAVNTNPLANINPNDIESIDVLKDPSAAAIYGARASNGVVLITTKRGSSGKTRFNLGYYGGTSEATRRLPLLNGPEWLQLYNEARVNDGQLPLGPNERINFPGTAVSVTPSTIANTNWLDEVLRTGIVHDASFNMSGGNDRTTFYLGTQFRDEEGFLRNNDFQRLGGRLNLDHKISDRIKVGTQIGLTRSIKNLVATSYNGGIGNAQSAAVPVFPVRNPDGSFFGTQFADVGRNPAAQLNNRYEISDYRTLTNLYAEWQISDKFSFRSEAGVDYFFQTEERFDSPINRFVITPTDTFQAGVIHERRVNVLNWNTNNFFTYADQFGPDHAVRVVVGTQAQKSVQNDIGYNPVNGFVGFYNPFFERASSALSFAPGTPTDQVFPNTLSAFNSQFIFGFLSYFGRAEYKFRDRYIFNLSMRSDGSSRFGPNERFGYFPAASVGWIMSEEGFMAGSEVLTFAKLRASFGVTGNAEIGNFGWLGSYQPGGGYLGQQGQQPTRLANPDLTWEQNIGGNLGFDFGFFFDRISGSLDVYQRNTSGLFVNRPVPSSTGFGTVPINANVEIRNRGVELSVRSNNLVGAFKWTTDLNIFSNQNRVLDIDGVTPDGFGGPPGDTRVIEGFPLGTSFLVRSAGVDPATGRELYLTFDGEVTDVYNVDGPSPFGATGDRVPVGKPNPDFEGGINNTFTYKGFDLSFLMTFSYGNTIYDDGAKFQIGGRLSEWNQRRELLNRWQSPENPGDGQVPRLSLTPDPINNNVDRFLYDGSFLRMRTISLGYTLPTDVLQRLSLASARVFVSAQNLFVLTRFPGWDPEVVRYEDRGNVAAGNIAFSAPYLPTPQARQITFGFNVGF